MLSNQEWALIMLVAGFCAIVVVSTFMYIKLARRAKRRRVATREAKEEIQKRMEAVQELRRARPELKRAK